MRVRRVLTSHWFLGSALALAFLAASLGELEPLLSAESRVFEGLVRLRGSRAGSQVVLVAIDDESLDRLGTWPWPRAVVAEGVRLLASSGASAVALHLPCETPEVNPGLAEIRDLRALLRGRSEPGGAELLGELSARLEDAEVRLDGDAALAAAAGEGRVVLPVRLDSGPFAGARKAFPEVLRGHLLALPGAPGSWWERLGDLRCPVGPWAWSGAPLGAVPPLASLLGGSPALGHASVLPDPDGVVRREALLAPVPGGFLPSLALRLAARAAGSDPRELRLDPDRGIPRGLRLGELHIPTDDGFRVLLDFGSPPPRVSFARLFRGEVAPDVFRGKAVLVGLTSRTQAPLHPVPGAGRLSSAELAALAAENLLGGRHLARPTWAWAVEAGFLLYLGLFAAFLAPRLSLRAGAAALGSFLLAWVGAAVFLALAQGAWLRVLAPVFLALSGFGLVAARRLAGGDASREENAELNRMLGLAYQGQGQLDQAFERLARCPAHDPAVRPLLYNLGLDFERKRMANKAAAVYRHLLGAGPFQDAEERVGRLESPERTVVLGAGGARAGDTLVLAPGTARPTLGRYEVVRELGQGAMGTVYLGRDPKIGRAVAIKTLRYGEIGAGELGEVKQRFFREAEAAGKLNHSGIVTVYDVGEDHDLAYLAMEYLEGSDLTRHCQPGRLLAVGTVVEVVGSVAEALDYAHRHGVVHRDVKPANIMLLADGRVKVTDFGIARVLAGSATQTGVVLGTPNYMSPEQVAGRRVDGRSDLFSLGVVFYELLAGERPFQGESMAAVLFAITKGVYKPLREVRRDAPACCAELVDRLLTRAVTRRIKTAAQLADELRMCRKRVR